MDIDSVDLGRYDFLDLGCSKGGSLQFCEGRFGGRGLGVDISERKVAAARDRGTDAVVADATRLGVQKQVRFVSMFDFLEHLPSLRTVESVIGQAAEVATDFLFIRHPSFEGEGTIEHLGVRQCWWTWGGHTAHIRIADYCGMFARLGLRRYRVHFNKPVADSGHDSVVPTSARADSFAYELDVHGRKPDVTFPAPLWRSQSIFVALRDMPEEEWASISDRP